ncbi:unnamed protein product, partial [Chrysoparadoxa australica]
AKACCTIFPVFSSNPLTKQPLVRSFTLALSLKAANPPPLLAPFYDTVMEGDWGRETPALPPPMPPQARGRGGTTPYASQSSPTSSPTVYGHYGRQSTGASASIRGGDIQWAGADWDDAQREKRKRKNRKNEERKKRKRQRERDDRNGADYYGDGGGSKREMKRKRSIMQIQGRKQNSKHAKAYFIRDLLESFSTEEYLFGLTAASNSLEDLPTYFRDAEDYFPVFRDYMLEEGRATVQAEAGRPQSWLAPVQLEIHGSEPLPFPGSQKKEKGRTVLPSPVWAADNDLLQVSLRMRNPTFGPGWQRVVSGGGVWLLSDMPEPGELARKIQSRGRLPGNVTMAIVMHCKSPAIQLAVNSKGLESLRGRVIVGQPLCSLIQLQRAYI